MFYIPTKILKLDQKIEPYSPEKVGNYNYKFGISPSHRPEYQEAISTHRLHYQEIVNAFHGKYGFPPFTYHNFLEFLKEDCGLKCQVNSFDKSNAVDYGIEAVHMPKGFWQWDNEEKSEFSVWVNTDYPPNTQNVSVIHEAIHALQDFDYGFHEILTRYSLPIRVRIAERVAELTAIAVVLPVVMLEDDKKSRLTPHQIAMKYEVSLQMAGYA